MPITSPRASARAFEAPPFEHHDPVEHRRQIVRSILDILTGRLNNTGSVTLTENVTTTTVTDRRVSASSHITFTPLTANAAAEMDGMYVSARASTAGTFVITHANAATTDRTFTYAIFG